MAAFRLLTMIAAVALAASAAEDITPHVSYIEIYGIRKISPQKIEKALGVKPGDRLPSRLDAETRIDKVSGVTESRVEAACCVGPNLVLYVGIEERDSPHMEYHATPSEDLTLPQSLFSAYRNLLDEVAGSIRGRNNDEDLTNGYSLMADPASRDLQKAFLPAVASDLPNLDRVVRDASDPEQRAAAAYLLQYAPRNNMRAVKLMTDGLQYALRDPDDSVRENAIEGLKAVMVGAKLHPEQNLRIEPTWFVELMNSVVWSDRRDACAALVDLTDSRDPDTLALLRDRALFSVVEMARWHQLNYALPAFILAARLAGLNEAAIQNAWVSGNREEVLSEVLHPKRKHSGA